MTEIRADIIKAAVERMQLRQVVPFDGERYDTSFTHGYRHFGEKVASLVAIQLHAALSSYLKDQSDTASLGSQLRPATRTINGKKMVDVIDVLTMTDADGDPRFMMQISSKSAVREGGDNVEQFELSVLETYKPSSGLVGYQTRIVDSSLHFNDDHISDMSQMYMDSFNSLTEFCSAISQALPQPLQLLSDRKIRMAVDPAYKDLIDADGGLPGLNSALAVEQYFADTARHVSDWAASRIPSIVENQMTRGFVWGQKYLNFNDLDDSCCAIPTDVPGRYALFHENISLINDYRSYIAWVDTDAEGIPTDLSVHMVHPDDHIGPAVERLVAGNLDPTLGIEFSTREVTLAANYLETDLLGTFAFYLRVDEKMYVEGEMDDDEPNVHTDFTDFYAEEPELGSEQIIAAP